MVHTTVIGAGPYGLSVAAHLRAAGVDTRVFGDPMASWRDHMPVGMYLKSEPSASSIAAPAPGYTLADYLRTEGRPPLEDPEPVPIDVFIDYGQWFQEQLVPVERDRVVAVRPLGNGFDVELDSGESFRSANVVVASGHVGHAYVPPELMPLAGGAPLPAPLLSHSSQQRDLAPFADREIAVIGAGQSALEFAALAHEAGTKVHVLVRAPRVVWGGSTRPAPIRGLRTLVKPPSPLGPGWSMVATQRGAPAFRHLPEATRHTLVRKILGPFGSWWLHDRVVGQVDLRVGTHVARAVAEDDKAHLDLAHRNGTTAGSLVVDHVVAATGYHVDVDSIECLDPELRRRVTRTRGYPVLDGSFQSSVPDLYFVGLASAATFGPLMRFVCGTDVTSPRVARAIASRA